MQCFLVYLNGRPGTTLPLGMGRFSYSNGVIISMVSSNTSQSVIAGVNHAWSASEWWRHCSWCIRAPGRACGVIEDCGVAIRFANQA